METELLQLSEREQTRKRWETEFIPLEDLRTAEAKAAREEQPDSVVTFEDTHRLVERHEREASPSLYKMGALFLTPFWNTVFSFIVLLHFVALLISYALAGGKAICMVRANRHFCRWHHSLEYRLLTAMPPRPWRRLSLC